MADVHVRDATGGDAAELRERLTDSWGSAIVVAHGVVYDTSELPALVAVEGSGEGADTGAGIAGLLTYHREPHAWEVVSLDAYVENIGVGTALLAEIERRAARAGADRFWLVTTNDNTHALRFYQRRGYDLTELRIAAVDESREIKPEIPEMSDGIPIRHELVLTKCL